MFIPSRFASRAWRSLIHFPAGATQTRSSVNGQSTGFLFQAYCRYYQSRSARLSQCIPLTIFHSATREPRPWHSPGRWLVGRLESLSSSPESHVADACLQTSVKSHGNGRRFTVNYLILTQLLDVVPRTYYSFFSTTAWKNVTETFLFTRTQTASPTATVPQNTEWHIMGIYRESRDSRLTAGPHLGDSTWFMRKKKMRCMYSFSLLFYNVLGFFFFLSNTGYFHPLQILQIGQIQGGKNHLCLIC